MTAKNKGMIILIALQGWVGSLGYLIEVVFAVERFSLRVKQYHKRSLWYMSSNATPSRCANIQPKSWPKQFVLSLTHKAGIYSSEFSKTHWQNNIKSKGIPITKPKNNKSSKSFAKMLSPSNLISFFQVSNKSVLFQLRAVSIHTHFFRVSS